MSVDKFRIDDIVLAPSLEIARQFECAICLHVVSDPVVQTPCGHVYCEKCLEPCSLCPQCREPFAPSDVKKLHEVNKMGMRMLQAVQVHCPYLNRETLNDKDVKPPDTKKPRVESSSNAFQNGMKREAKTTLMSQSSDPSLPDVCTWTGSYGDLLAKHFCECPFHPVHCPRGCGQRMRRGELVAHQRVCPMTREECPICGVRLPPDQLQEHNRTNALEHVDILSAKLLASEVAASEQASISARLAKVEDLLKSRQATHVRMRTEEIKQIVSSQLIKTVEWPIKDIGRIKSLLNTSQCLASQEFCLGGIEGFTLRFFPNGHGDDSRAPCISIQNDPGQISASVRVKLPTGEVKTIGHNFDWEKEECIMNIAGQESNECTVEVELLSGSLKRQLHENNVWSFE